MAYKKRGKIKKYYTGTPRYQTVEVPQVSSGADVASKTLKTAASGAMAGASIAGPWGAVIGGAVGAVYGGVSGKMMQSTERAAAQGAVKQNRDTLAINKSLDALDQENLGTPIGGFYKEQGMSRQDSTKMIEIEGKGTPEIHTDKNYNIKSFGTAPHSKGGTKVVASEGDVVFDTQNSKEDYARVMNDIKSYKLRGDKKAYSRLEKRRKEMPADESIENARGNSGVDYLKDTPHTYTDPMLYEPGKPLQILPLDPLQAEYMSVQDPGSVPLYAPSKYAAAGPMQDTMMPVGEDPGIYIPNGGVPRSEEEKRARRDNTMGAINEGSRNANILNNILQGAKPAQTANRREFTPNLLTYKDTSERLEAGALRNYKTMQSNIGKVGSSRGQQLSQQTQANASYLQNQADINNQEYQKRLGIENANMQVLNNAGMVNYQANNIYDQQDLQSKAAKQSFINAASAEYAQISETRRQQDYMKSRDKKMDAQQDLMIKNGILNSKYYQYATDKGFDLNEFLKQSNYTKEEKDAILAEHVRMQKLADEESKGSKKSKGTSYTKIKKTK